MKRYINPNNWYYMVESGKDKGCVVCPVSVVGDDTIMCEVMHSDKQTSKTGDITALKPDDLILLKDDEYASFGLFKPNCEVSV